ncbi:MAG: toll/interleukin-1 receptor domain-containing protein [Roseiarcus sp.]|jgi:hypothetical protein
MAGPKQCFISYSHQDHEAFARLLVHLKPVAHLYDFKMWHDHRLTPGYHWSDVIRTEIARSDILVGLITNDFFASDYIWQQELPAMVARHQKDGALLVPVIYRNSCWRFFFGPYIDAAPKNAKGNLVPVHDWKDRENALAVAANAIAGSIEDWFGVKPRPIFSPLPPRRGKP